MKRFLAWLLLAATLLSLCGCAQAPTAPDAAEALTDTTAVEAPVAELQPTAAETEPLLEGSLFLKVSSITFSLVGESDDIYLGLIPREELTWESDDPAVVSVENGVLTATGVGTTTVRAIYGDRQVECTAGCLAQTQEELDLLDPEILSAPKCLPPEVDLEEPCTYFDNAAMIGDSITYFLWQSESQNNYLGNTVFITRQGVSINSLVRRFKNIYFQGKEMNIEDIADKCNAERLYIMLGCLDFQVNAARHFLIENWTTMLDRITQKCPEIEIVIVSNIPSYTEEAAVTDLNQLILETNGKLRQLAADKGYGFLDLGYYVQDHYGRIPAIYAKDTYHMNGEGSLVWMKVLRYYAQYELEGGVLA